MIFKLNSDMMFKEAKKQNNLYESENGSHSDFYFFFNKTQFYKVLKIKMLCM